MGSTGSRSKVTDAWAWAVVAPLLVVACLGFAVALATSRDLVTGLAVVATILFGGFGVSTGLVTAFGLPVHSLLLRVGYVGIRSYLLAYGIWCGVSGAAAWLADRSISAPGDEPGFFFLYWWGWSLIPGLIATVTFWRIRRPDCDPA